MSPDFEIFIVLILSLVFVALAVGLQPIAATLFIGLLFVLCAEAWGRGK